MEGMVILFDDKAAQRSFAGLDDGWLEAGGNDFGRLKQAFQNGFATRPIS